MYRSSIHPIVVQYIQFISLALFPSFPALSSLSSPYRSPPPFLIPELIHSVCAGRTEDSAVSGDDEAEFAWLSVDCLKPFLAGDTCGGAGLMPSPEDGNLRACIAAANKAVLVLQSRLAERNAAVAAAGDELLVAEEDSDSDGGAWGLPDRVNFS